LEPIKENQQQLIDEYETSKNRHKMLKNYQNYADFQAPRGSKQDTFRINDLLDNDLTYKNNIGKLTQTYDQSDYSYIVKKGSSSPYDKKTYKDDYDFEKQRGSN
jgi:hypothetical protein